MELSKRIHLWDNLKCLLILFVVLGHFIALYTTKSSVFKGIFLFIYSFHMPLFIFISGYFHKNRDVAKKVLFYISVGCLSKFLFFLEDFFLGGKPKLDFFTESGLPWFMFALGIFIGIAYLLRDINRKYVLIVSVLIGSMVGYDNKIQDFLVLSRIFVYFPFYVAGIYVYENCRERFSAIISSKKSFIVSVLIILAWLTACILLVKHIYFLRPFFTGRNPYPMALYYSGAAIRILCYFITSIVSFSFICIIPKVNLKFLTECGRTTLQIYFWHYIALKILLLYPILNLCASTGGKFVYLLIAVLLTFILSTRIFGFPVKIMKRYCLEM